MPGAGHPTWASEYARVWTREMGGWPAMGKLVRYIKPLHDLYGPDKVSRALGIYLRDLIAKGDGRYASIARFSQTIKLWLPTETERWCANHPNIGMYGVKDGRSLCLECWNNAKDVA